MTRGALPRAWAAAAIALLWGGAGRGAALVPAADAIPLPSRDDAWVQVRTANFTLYGNANPSKIKDAGLNLERLRAVLLLMKKSLTANSPVPTSVFVFKSHAALEPYLPLVGGKPANSDGYFQSTNDGNFITFTAAWNVDPRPLVYHEYLHYFLNNNFPPQPTWYDEGVAEFYSTFQSTKEEAQTGMVVHEHLQLLRDGKLMPLEQLFAVRSDSPEYNEESKQGTFYAESWALVHYLMRGNPDRTPQLGRFLLLLQNGRIRDEAFREAFQTDYATLLKELAAYLRNSRFFYSRLKFSELKLSDETHVEPMRWEEVVAHLGDFLAHGGEDRLSQAERYLTAALAANPAHAGALASMAWIRIRQKRYDEVADFVQRAVASGSTDFRVYYYGGLSRMHELSQTVQFAGRLDAKARATLEEARSDFRRSIELNDGFPEAQAALGRSYLAEVGPAAADGIPILEAAVARLPSREDLARDLQSLRERARFDAAGASGSGPPATPRPERLVRNAELDRVHALLAKGQIDEAIAALEELLRSTPEEDRALVEDELAAARLKSSWRRSRREYEQAMALLKKGDRRGALARLRALLAMTGVPRELANSARAKVAELESVTRPAARTPVP